MPKELTLNASNSFIGSWFIDDVSLCDELIEYFENSTNKGPGYVVNDQGSRIDKSVKDSIDLNLNPNEEIVVRYANQLQAVLNEYIIKYPYSNKTAPFRIESATLQKYNPEGGFFQWHAERTSASPPSVFRHLVFMTYLNDVNDAGETEFFHQNLKVKPQKGLTLIWPADWTHTHRGITSMTETKYIVTGWYIFIDRPNLVDKSMERHI